MKEIDIKFKEFKTHAYIQGKIDDKHEVILMLHGGPGNKCNYLKPLFDLNKYGYTCISYDQLGFGKSSRIKGRNNLMKVSTFREELDNLVKTLKLKNFILLGHSWGGQLALEYVLNIKNNSVKKLILFSSLSSSKIWSESNYKICCNLLKDKPQKLKLLKSAFKKSYFFDKDVDKLCNTELWNMYYRNRSNTSPYERKKSKHNAEIYEYMWGRNDLFVEGTLKNWDLTPRLKEIKIPTLVIHGKTDQSTKECNEVFLKNIKNSKEVYLEHSGHGGYYNEYKKVINSILKFIK